MGRTAHPGEPAASAPPAQDTTSPGGSVSRRQLLARLAALGIATTGLGTAGLISYREEAAAAATSGSATVRTGSTAKHAWAMVIDLRYCDGCEACTMACQQRHDLPVEQKWIKVYPMTDSEGGTFHMPRPCMMCEDPPCMYVCPVGATFRDDTGLVLVDQSVCIGCRTCMAACPYEARYFNWTDPPKPKNKLPLPPTPQMPVPQQKGTVGKCVFCADRLPHAELPACVSGCPMGVLYIGDLVTDVATNGLGETVQLSTFLKDNDAVRFKEDLGTNPRVYYILGHGQALGA